MPAEYFSIFSRIILQAAHSYSANLNDGAFLVTSEDSREYSDQVYVYNNNYIMNTAKLTVIARLIPHSEMSNMMKMCILESMKCGNLRSLGFFICDL